MLDHDLRGHTTWPISLLPVFPRLVFWVKQVESCKKSACIKAWKSQPCFHKGKLHIAHRIVCVTCTTRKKSICTLILWTDLWKVLCDLFWLVCSWDNHQKYNYLLHIMGWNTDKSDFFFCFWGDGDTIKQNISSLKSYLKKASSRI